ncbi:MAG: isochorismatase family protein [Psychromonas sp.]|nr:isochorismatase family protein [Psychromonas sp.]
MYIHGSFYSALLSLIAKKTKIGLLIIDEHSDAVIDETSNTPGKIFIDVIEAKDPELTLSSNVTACQQRVLMCMQAMDYPVFSINNEEDNNIPDPTRTEIKGLYNINHHVMIKSLSNAFAETNLTQMLNNLQVKHLVVMGWDANVCVPATIGMLLPLYSWDILY